MLPSQKIELLIYKLIKPLGLRAVPIELATLTQATGEDQSTVVERLKSLEAENRIFLSKYSGGSVWPRKEFKDNDSKFFYRDSFLIEIVPEGRNYFEELEHLAEQENQKQLVFISCGQYLPTEIQLGKNLAATVNSLTSWEGYSHQHTAGVRNY
jgi:DNA-binding MarR family transcriptional regulator